MKRLALAIAALTIIGFATSSAEAGSYHGGHRHGGHSHGGHSHGGHFHGGGGRGYRAPIYHGPSVHYDRIYHADRLHWTPGRGLHTHGHYHVVPHYTPGHYDTFHRGHIHGNPWYHH